MSVLKTAKNPGEKKALFDFTNGINADRWLYRQEIKVQKEWVQSLTQIDILSESEAKQINLCLEEALQLIEQNKFQWRIEDEDIHMNLERFVTEKLGELGKKMHLGRSRNDLIATTLRLFIRDSIYEVHSSLTHLINILTVKAKDTATIIVPGSTHLQHAQPIRFGHILASFGWSFLRDKENLIHAAKQTMSNMPLGSAALAGTTLPINLSDLSQRLEFTAPPFNSYDSVGDRDFILNTLNAFSGIAIHLSRLAEDIIFWASTPVGLVALPKNWSTGSSIMPNKRNPDVPELVRAKSAHILAAQTNGFMLMKALPTSYDSDLHELKSVYLRSFSELKSCLDLIPTFINELAVHSDKADDLLKGGHLLATEVANHLTLRGLNFRDAYSLTASLVEFADSVNCSIEQIPQDQLKKLAPQIDLLWWNSLSFAVAAESRKQEGGTALAPMMKSLDYLHHLNN
ncbi:MAG: argininosuccinate lyase [Bdellovibrionales bacterium]|nr:argininosuccinate lyase [Bdellovibrionales bacterium]